MMFHICIQIKENLILFTQVHHTWWFYSRDNEQSSGYVDDGVKKGLCEYVALLQILLYNQLFVNPMIFSENKFKHYFQEQRSDTLENSSPVFRYWLRNDPKNSLVWDLYKNTNYAVNLWNSGWFETISNKLIKENNMSLSNWKYIQKYGGYKLTWETVKRGIPIILGLAPRPEWDQWMDHAYLMYRYDSPTDMFLSSLCWDGKETTSVLFSYWVECWGSYCFELEPTSYAIKNRFLKFLIIKISIIQEIKSLVWLMVKVYIKKLQ